MVQTSCGTFEIALDTERAPKTANSFAFLAEEGFYDDLDLPPDRPRIRDPGRRPARHRHRRPRLQRASRSRPANLAYTKGTVAMAKSSAEPPGTLRQPVLRRHRRRTPDCRPNTRWSARSARASTWSNGSASWRTRSRRTETDGPDRNDHDRKGLAAAAKLADGEAQGRRPGPGLRAARAPAARPTGSPTTAAASWSSPSTRATSPPSAPNSSAPTATRASSSTASAPRCSGSRRSRSSRTSASSRRRS